MNNRIKELALQASEYVNSVYTPPVRSKTPGKIWEDGHIGWHTQFNEKLAELIVRECAGVCDDERDSTDSEFGKLVAEGCALKIMERFGVEE